MLAAQQVESSGVDFAEHGRRRQCSGDPAPAVQHRAEPVGQRNGCALGGWPVLHLDCFRRQDPPQHGTGRTELPICRRPSQLFSHLTTCQQ